MKLVYPEYLGDGVYASFDGYHIWLHVGDHRSEPVVALEPEVLAALFRYQAHKLIDTNNIIAVEKIEYLESELAIARRETASLRAQLFAAKPTP